jgi:hypothetical protein
VEERATKLSLKRPSSILIQEPSLDTILVCHVPRESPLEQPFSKK